MTGRVFLEIGPVPERQRGLDMGIPRWYVAPAATQEAQLVTGCMGGANLHRRS